MKLTKQISALVLAAGCAVALPAAAAQPAGAQAAAVTPRTVSTQRSAAIGQAAGLYPAAVFRARPAAAAPDGGGFNGPVVTYPPAPPIDYAAGVVCPFPMHVTFFDDQVVQRTWYSDAGQPVFATATGALKMRVTNTATGRSAVRNISGSGSYSFPDGISFVLSANQFVAFMHTGDTPANKVLVIGKNGFAAVRVATVNGVTTKTVLTLKGPYEDLCQTLGSG